MPVLLGPDADLSVRVAAGLIFAAATFGKLRQPARFADTLLEYRLLPGRVIGLVARGLPVAELAIAAALPAGVLRPWPAVAAAALLTLFAGAMALNLWRGRTRIACGCSLGLAADRGLRWAFVARNLATVAALLAGAGSREPGLAQAADGLLGGVALFLVIEAANSLWALPPANPSSSLGAT